MRRVLVLVCVLVVACYTVGAVVFVGRADDELAGTADAVVALAGAESRLPVALSLVRDGVAPVFVVSEDPSGEDAERTRLCDRGRVDGAELVCRTASPYSTRGEARLVAALARDRGWDRIVVVTSRYHLFRAKRLFARCTDAELVMRGSGDGVARHALAIPLEWAKLALAETLRRGC